jgi:hypothetical protein
MMAQGIIPACLATADLCGSYVGADDAGFPRAMNDLLNEWRQAVSLLVVAVIFLALGAAHVTFILRRASGVR